MRSPGIGSNQNYQHRQSGQAGLNKITTRIVGESGVEYVIPPAGNRGVAIALRAGSFTEGDSALRAVSTGSDSFASSATFPGGETEIHVSGGIGLSWRRVKLDAGFDLADPANIFVVSLIIKGK